MAKVDLGTKRKCPSCEVKFYDLTRVPATCPECQNSFDPEELLVAATQIPVHEEPVAENDDDDEDDDLDEEDKPKKEEVDPDDIDEAEEEAKELELDGDDAAVIAGGSEGPTDDYDGFSTDEDEEDADAALVDDDDNELPPPDADDAPEDDAEEVEI